ncbi:peptidase M20 domain-containing protein 2 [Elysia marginata]|uniref:Peptidase M20 domain-containing protein 2 n=1 Tax=Elysia marginata TaxID=1093978 RepID=A0AAV4IPL2_9GAST|nr:peptidase M20 domain-containing protein 2 [Elysia marginata]
MQFWYCTIPESLLNNKITKEEELVVLFDEAYNKDLGMKKKDIHIRIWDGDMVKTRYYGSCMMGHATAQDIFDQLIAKTAVPFRKIVQLSMDGPNVN